MNHNDTQHKVIHGKRTQNICYLQTFSPLAFLSSTQNKKSS